jgi:hypothetical protein
MGRMTTRRILFACTLLISFLQFWHHRFQMYSDGIAYLEVARKLEVNAYWSPLFSWLLIPVVRFVPLAWSATAVHALQAVFAVIAVLLADQLWRRLSPCTAEDRGWMITRWMAAWWAVFSLTSISLVQPDVLTACLYLAACLLVLDGKPVSLGLVLAAAYLTKAAMLPFAAVLLACWFLVDRRRAVVAGAVLVVCCAPWLIALRQHTGRWTIGDSGPLNYSWEVNGLTRWIHGQGGVNSDRQISSAPDAFVYPEPFDTVYPPWYKPSYWFAGLEKTPFSLANQLRALQENGAAALWHWFSTPGLLAVLALGARMRDWSGLWAEVRSRWLLLLPALATTGMYVAVFFETRYIAPQYLLLGTIPLHAAYLRCGPPASRLFPIAASAALFFSLAAELGMSAKSLIVEGNSPNPFVAVAAELHAAGATPGTRVAFVGPTLKPEWARQAGLRIVGDVPMIYDRDPGPNRYINFNRTNLNSFWYGSPSARERVYRGFAAAGARFVVSQWVPPDADTTGWTRLSTKVNLLAGASELWIRPLTPSEDLPATSAVDTSGPTPAAAQGSAAPKTPPGPA